jgi:hypothetical protein
VRSFCTALEPPAPPPAARIRAGVRPPAGPALRRAERDQVFETLYGRGTFGHPSTVHKHERPGVVRGHETNRRSHRGNGYLAAAAGVAVAFAASSCAGSDGSGAAKTTKTVVVTTTAAATPEPAVTTTDDSQVALRQLLSGVSTAKVELAQYQQDLEKLCGSGLESKSCWVALRYSRTVGTDITGNLKWVSKPPDEVVDLWNSTAVTAIALETLDIGWCAPGRDFRGCHSHVIGTVQKLTQQFAGWDPYLAPQ